MIELALLFFILYGYLCHQSRDFVYDKFGPGWRELVSYTLGVTMVFPAFVYVMWEMFNHDWGAVRKAMLGYSLAYIPFGVGTFIGWVLDGIQVVSKRSD